MSEIVIKHFGNIRNSIKTYYDPRLHTENEKAIEAAGGEFVETIRLKGKRVTADQFAYFFGGVVATALEFNCYAGWTKKSFQKHYEDEFLSEPVMYIKHNDDGSIRSQKQGIVTKGIEELNRKEMAEFTEKVIRVLAEEGIVVLTPEQYELTKYQSIIQK